MKTFIFRKSGDIFSFRYFSRNGEATHGEDVERSKLSRHIDALHDIGYVMRIDGALR